MPPVMAWQPRVVPYRPDVSPAIVEVWNAAMGDAFPLDAALLRQNTIDDPQFDPAGAWVACAHDGPHLIGACIAKVAREPLGSAGLLTDRGWVSAIVVHPSAQRRGIGTALLRQAEAFLRGRGRRLAVLGSDPGHFFPGVPVGTRALEFFAARGYRMRGDAYDLRRSLRGYCTPRAVTSALAGHPDVEIRPLRRGEEHALLAFLDAHFPGRWRYDVGRFLAGGGDVGDIVGLLRGGKVLGMAHVFHPGSKRIGPSIAWTRGGAGAGGLGPMGLAESLRGRGLGLALLDRAIVRLAQLGVQEMVIDWTVLLDFYGRLGFVPWKRYRHGERRLGRLGGVHAAG
jgi:GNAT superfamily N-acetyltransferase